MHLDGRRALIASSTLAITLTAASHRLEPQSLAPQDLPVFGTGVEVVAVPVSVTDKDGRAVPGLTADDFEVEDQGREVEIVAFQAVDARAPLAPSTAGPLIQAASRRQFLLLFDLTFSTPVGIMKARDAAVEFVETALAPADLAAVATYGQSGVRLLVGFTTDRYQLGRAIDDLGLTETVRTRDPLSLAWDIGLNLRPGASALREPTDLEQFLEDQLGLLGRTDSEIYRQRVTTYLGSLQQLARMLDGLQGRKHVILLSGGFDSTVFMGEQGIAQRDSSRAVTEGRLWEVQSDSYFGDAASRQQLDELYDVFAASDSVLHTVDVSGLTTGVSADSAGPTSPGRGRETLAQFALNTGGHFVRDANDLEGGLQELLDATRYYYVLAFEPRDPGKNRDKLRKLKVEARGRDLKVSHRAGYVLSDPDSVKDAVTGQLQAAETISKGISGGAIALRAVAVPYRDTKERTLLPVVLEIDGESLLRGEKADQLSLEIFGYALDADGRIYDVLSVRPTLDLGQSGEAIRTRGLQILTTFVAPDGQSDLRFLVRKAGGGGRAGSLRLEATVPTFEGEALALSPPLFMDDPRARLVLPAASRANPSLEIPFRLEDMPFTLDARPTLARGERREVCVMAWSGPRHATTSPYELTAELAGGTDPIPVKVAEDPRIVADADGFQRFVVALDPGKPPAGQYTLRLSFRDPETGVVTPTETRVAVN